MVSENLFPRNSVGTHVTLRQASNGQRLFKLVYVDARGPHPVAVFVRDNSVAALLVTGKAYADQRGFAWRPDLAIVTNPANSPDFTAICSREVAS